MDSNKILDKKEYPLLLEPDLTEEYFYKSLFLSDFSINEEGEMTLYYGDEKEIFAGHAIEVRMNAEGEIKNATLVG